jgi:hypothetical protein
MSDSSWSRIRLRLFAYLTTAILLLSFFEGNETSGGKIAVSALIALVVIFDVVYHSAMGKGQACRTCGHIRQMKPFRVYGSCPKCGAR